jgi:5-methyltetrahydropteroyltriglutamate--homocysteine methyltransferase
VEDLDALAQVHPKIKLGLGVIDVKINHVETPDEVACRMGWIENRLGAGRLGWVHPDCGFWMLKRSVADRKMEALVKGRDSYLGR